jgi:actin related protein 2/3 complex subunit 5
MDALAAAKSTEISAIAKGLSQAQLDTLTKYIYKGMASPEKFNPAVLLNWHAAVRPESVFLMGR